MQLTLRNNGFLFSHLWPLYFCFFWFKYINTLIAMHNLDGFFFPPASNWIILRHQIKSKFVFWKQHIHAGSLDDCLEDVFEVPLQWKHSTTLTLSTQKFLWICLIYSCVLFCSHSCAACLFFAGMMIDSSLIYMTGLFPADAAESLAEEVHGASVWEQCCVSPNSPPDVTICPSVCRAEWCDVSAFLRSAETQVHLSFTSPSVSTHLFIYSQRASACLRVCSATVTASSF